MDITFKSLNSAKTEATFLVGSETVKRPVAEGVADMDSHILALARGLAKEYVEAPEKSDTSIEDNTVLISSEEAPE